MSDTELNTDDQSEASTENGSAHSNEYSETEENPSDGLGDRTTTERQPLRQRDRPELPGGVSETFQKRSTVNQIKSTLAVFFGTGIGAGIAGFAVVGAAASVGRLSGVVMVVTSALLLALIGPVLGVITATHTGRVLSDEPASQTYATAGVSSAGGHILLFVVSYIVISAGTSLPSRAIPGVSAYLIPALIGAFGTAIAAVVTVYAVRNFSE